MDSFLKGLLGGASGLGAYGLVFGVLTACGLGLPLPEDISLILGGFLAHKGAANLWLMMLTGLAGILVGDSMIFSFGRRFGSRVGTGGGTGFIGRFITPEKRARVEGLYHLHGDKIVMIARFMPGVRTVAYFTAGSVGMKYTRFLLWDGLASLLSAPLFVFLGYYFGDELDMLIHRLKEGQMGVLAGVGVVVVAWLGYRAWKKRRQATPIHTEPHPGAVAVIKDLDNVEAKPTPEEKAAVENQQP